VCGQCGLNRLGAGAVNMSLELWMPKSGLGLEDVALVRAGARSVLGIDYSQVAVRAARRRADELGVACRYVVAPFATL